MKPPPCRTSVDGCRIKPSIYYDYTLGCFYRPESTSLSEGKQYRYMARDPGNTWLNSAGVILRTYIPWRTELKVRISLYAVVTRPSHMLARFLHCTQPSKQCTCELNILPISKSSMSLNLFRTAEWKPGQRWQLVEHLCEEEVMEFRDPPSFSAKTGGAMAPDTEPR